MTNINEDTIHLLSALRYRVDAKHGVNIIPLGSIYWEDEMPNLVNLFDLPSEEQGTIYMIFNLRMKVWDKEPFSAEETAWWDAVRAAVPDWALFNRLNLSDDDRRLREVAEASVEKEFEGCFKDAD